jgi:integrase
VRQAHRVLSLALDLAVRDGRLPRNAAAGVRLPRGAKRTKRFLSHVEVAQLAEACGPYGLLVQVLAYTGLRWGEVAALRVQDVDLARRRLRVDRAMVEVNGRAIFGTPKNHQRRAVPVPRFLVNRLAEHVAGRSGDELLFPSPEGAVLRIRTYGSGVFDQAVASVGLGGLTPHELRHTAASLAVAAGANVKAVQQMLGHASAAMTLDVYAGLFGDDLDAVADRLDEAVKRVHADQVRTERPLRAVDGAS